MPPAGDPNRQRNIYLMVTAVVLVIVWLLWTVISPGDSSSSSPTTATTPTTVTVPTTATVPTVGTTATVPTTATTGTTSTTGDPEGH